MNIVRFKNGGWYVSLWPIVFAHHNRYNTWVRIGRSGPGVKVIDSRTGWVPFSIREGLQRSLKMGPFIVTGMGRA